LTPVLEGAKHPTATTLLPRAQPHARVSSSPRREIKPGSTAASARPTVFNISAPFGRVTTISQDIDESFKTLVQKPPPRSDALGNPRYAATSGRSPAEQALCGSSTGPTSEISGRFVPEATCMTELEAIFAELGISHYLNDFIEQGFDSWDTILDITESDFDALGVKLGHRRKLQRKIANSRGLSPDRALASPTRNTPNDDRQAEEQRAGAAKAEGKEPVGGSGPQGAKRKYRRHPKPDENAPERPPSAYVIFSNKMREELKGRNLSFTEIAKLVGENWQSLSPREKEPYEQQAFSAKERYNSELSEYKKTSQYREYAQYLAEFKARQSNQQQGTSQCSVERDIR
jgi:hypothetical protein